MSEQKYFSLISGAKIEKAPEVKIIPAREFTELLNAMELKDRILKEGEEYKQKVARECEKLKEEAKKAGFDKGYTEWAAQLVKLEEEIRKIHDEMLKLVMPIALKAAKKIVASELVTSQDTIIHIVTESLKAAAQYKKIVLYVNKADFDTLESNKSNLKGLFEHVESFAIRVRDDVEAGGCIIETEAGIINAQMQDRWKNLETAFAALGAQLKKGTLS